MLKILKLFIVIANISYLTGVGWLILCEAIRDFILNIDTGPEFEDSPSIYAENYPEGFLTAKGIMKNTREQNLVVSIYFAFTSLSTVGFGDYVPCSNIERFIGAFILLFGVSIFSYIMGNFIEIIGVMGEINGSFNDGDNLTRFFGLIKRFNNDRDINRDLMLRIEDYFEYKWEEDVNLAIITDDDFSLLNQL